MKSLAMQKLMNKNFDNDEILDNVDKRVEAKVMRGEITGLDVPY